MADSSVAALDIVIAKGEDADIPGTHRSAKGSSTPVDISGWTIVLTVRPQFSSDAIFSANATIVDGPQGAYSISLTHSQTNIAAGSYVCDIWRADAGFEAPLGIGKFTVRPDAKYGA